MKPRVPLTSKEFIYRNAASTDVRKTWADARKRAESPVTTKASHEKPGPRYPRAA